MPPQQSSSTTTTTSSSKLTFTKKNQNMTKLPTYAKVHKRPIPHPAPPTPYTGPSTPKTIYVSTSTPKMSVVTRVRKLLRQAEKRATAALHNNASSHKHRGRAGAGTGAGSQAELLAKVQEALRREEVHVKATGRAIGKAVAVGEYFRRPPTETEGYRVEVRTGGVMVVDDVEVDEEAKQRVLEQAEVWRREVESGVEEGSGRVLSKAAIKKRRSRLRKMGVVDGQGKEDEKVGDVEEEEEQEEGEGTGEAEEAEEEELPESRTRWVNMVDVVIGLKG
ncbi:ribonuclease P subunit p20 family protein [Aspergillus saccharolyticus JOP 1030-1]|uniref:Uncharacterized protein n=1 Tax=Aspergillus saccharolyticus JOP 1030-1 TaxID=1450539 RepID=A0A318Z2F9_9EURO|nr:hypothetical protein BP01DRAFT_377747 [Aspergillus saccharolyticus JOP 1030-1]PYH40564.1 hypothetical protein BP01DRAFT_377747 [Aspergillus saccharolyticus JOP 1030-1]